MSNPLVVLVVCVCAVCTVQGYSRGPPTDHCGDMNPAHGHGPSRAQGASPYVITHTVRPGECVSSGDTITVSISGGSRNTDPYRGFFLQARAYDDVTTIDTSAPIGSFTLDRNARKQQLLDCGGDQDNAVSHYNLGGGDTFDRVDAVWEVPDGVAGNVAFRATIVKSISEYWVGVLSEAIPVCVGDEVTETEQESTEEQIIDHDSEADESTHSHQHEHQDQDHDHTAEAEDEDDSDDDSSASLIVSSPMIVCLICCLLPLVKF